MNGTKNGVQSFNDDSSYRSVIFLGAFIQGYKFFRETKIEHFLLEIGPMIKSVESRYLQKEEIELNNKYLKQSLIGKDLDTVIYFLTQNNYTIDDIFYNQVYDRITDQTDRYVESVYLKTDKNYFFIELSHINYISEKEHKKSGEHSLELLNSCKVVGIIMYDLHDNEVEACGHLDLMSFGKLID